MGELLNALFYIFVLLVMIEKSQNVCIKIVYRIRLVVSQSKLKKMGVLQFAYSSFKSLSPLDLEKWSEADTHTCIINAAVNLYLISTGYGTVYFFGYRYCTYV